MKPTEDITRKLRDIVGLASALEVNAPPLMRRSSMATKDGYPTSSRGEGGGTPTSRCEECDEHGVIDNRVCGECGGSGRVSDRGMHSDPTASAALTEGARDIVQDDALGMVRAINKAYRALMDASSAVDHARPVVDKPKSVAGCGDCSSCRRYCPGEPDRLRSGMCKACYDAYSRLPHPRPERSTFHHVTLALLRATGTDGYADDLSGGRLSPEAGRQVFDD